MITLNYDELIREMDTPGIFVKISGTQLTTSWVNDNFVKVLVPMLERANQDRADLLEELKRLVDLETNLNYEWPHCQWETYHKEKKLALESSKSLINRIEGKEDGKV